MCNRLPENLTAVCKTRAVPLLRRGTACAMAERKDVPLDDKATSEAQTPPRRPTGLAFVFNSLLSSLIYVIFVYSVRSPSSYPPLLPRTPLILPFMHVVPLVTSCSSCCKARGPANQWSPTIGRLSCALARGSRASSSSSSSSLEHAHL